jgi:hypothetical protein
MKKRGSAQSVNREIVDAQEPKSMSDKFVKELRAATKRAIEKQRIVDRGGYE